MRGTWLLESKDMSTHEMTVCAIGSGGFTTIRTSRFFVNSQGNWNINISRLITLYQTKQGTPVGSHLLASSTSASVDVQRSAIDIGMLVEAAEGGAGGEQNPLLEERFPITVHSGSPLPSQAKMKCMLMDETTMTIKEAKAAALSYYNSIKYRRRKSRIDVALNFFRR